MSLLNLESTLHTFCKISGMDVGVFDSQFRCILNITSQNTTFCSMLHRNKQCLKVCRSSDMEAFRHVEQTGAPYRYTCPFGFFEAIVPITENDSIIAYLIIGPAVNSEKEAGNFHPLKSCMIPSEFQSDLLRTMLQKAPHYTEEELDAYYEAFLLFSQHIEANDFLSVQHQTLGQMTKQYIRKNLNSKITLAELSTKLHCSTVTLTETFRKEFGMTIMQYTLNKRLSLAKKKLTESDRSISEIAEDCGFPNTEYFSKCFKTAAGISPSEWRKQFSVAAGEP